MSSLDINSNPSVPATLTASRKIAKDLNHVSNVLPNSNCDEQKVLSQTLDSLASEGRYLSFKGKVANKGILKNSPFKMNDKELSEWAKNTTAELKNSLNKKIDISNWQDGLEYNADGYVSRYTANSIYGDHNDSGCEFFTYYVEETSVQNSSKLEKYYDRNGRLEFVRYNGPEASVELGRFGKDNHILFEFYDRREDKKLVLSESDNRIELRKPENVSIFGLPSHKIYSTYKELKLDESQH